LSGTDLNLKLVISVSNRATSLSPLLSACSLRGQPRPGFCRVRRHPFRGEEHRIKRRPEDSMRTSLYPRRSHYQSIVTASQACTSDSGTGTGRRIFCRGLCDTATPPGYHSFSNSEPGCKEKLTSPGSRRRRDGPRSVTIFLPHRGFATCVSVQSRRGSREDGSGIHSGGGTCKLFELTRMAQKAAAKQATLGYVRNSQLTIGCVDIVALHGPLFGHVC
jgi:hypothetical protein